MIRRRIAALENETRRGPVLVATFREYPDGSGNWRTNRVGTLDLSDALALEDFEAFVRDRFQGFRPLAILVSRTSEAPDWHETR